MKKVLLLGVCLFFFANSASAQNSISGYIVSLETAKPIANATVFLNNKYNLPLEDPDSLRATSDSNGFFEIAGIKTGTYIINAWTTYRVIDQRYAMVISSDRIEIDRSIDVDFVFSENAFKYRLDFKSRLKEARKSIEAAKAYLEKSKARFKKKERSSNAVARRAASHKFYIDSKRVPYGWSYIKQINDSKE